MSPPNLVKRTPPVALDLDREGKTDDAVTQDVIIPDHEGTPFFEAGDGDLQLWVDEECFETHKYLIKRFNGLKGLLRTHTTTTTLHVPLGLNGHNSEDFRRTLKVLYTTIPEGPPEFDSDTLVSALRIATVFDYPALRAYTIKHLEQAQLSAIERIKAAREFDLPSWEGPAYLELCDRDEAVTVEEASALGMDAFVRVAGIREREQRRRGRYVDAEQEQGRAESSSSAGFTAAAENGNSAGGGTPTMCEVSSSTEVGGALPETNSINFGPSFIDVPTGHGIAYDRWNAGINNYRILVSGCECQILNPTGGVYARGRCGVVPCVAMAFKNLQAQQIAHTNAIIHLQSNLNELANTSSPPTISTMPSASTSGTSVQEEVRHMVLAIQKPQVQSGA